MTKTFIISKFNYEGFHKWENAPEEVSYLRARHRHLFYYEVYIEVFHDDRDIEFISFGNWLKDEILKAAGSEVGGKSCEMLAKETIEIIRKKYGKKREIQVKLFEDNENGSLVKDKGND